MSLGKQGNITKTLLPQSRKALLRPALHHEPGRHPPPAANSCSVRQEWFQQLQLNTLISLFGEIPCPGWAFLLGLQQTQSAAETALSACPSPNPLPSSKLTRWCCNPKSTSDVTQVTESQQDSGIVNCYPVIRQRHHPLSYLLLGHSAIRHPVWWAAVLCLPKGRWKPRVFSCMPPVWKSCVLHTQ